MKISLIVQKADLMNISTLELTKSKDRGYKGILNNE